MRCRIHRDRSESSTGPARAATSSQLRTVGWSFPGLGSLPTDSSISNEDPTKDTTPFLPDLRGSLGAVSARIWLQACFDFAQTQQIEARYVDALHAFAYPNPRGGPPPPPEPRWSDDFEALETVRCARLLSEPALRDRVVANLSLEVDEAQAEIFARRIAAVEHQLIELGDATGRLLRVGLRQRLEGILQAPRPRALRVRALADFYYSFAGRRLHARRTSSPAPRLVDATASLSWAPVFEGGELAVIDGVFSTGPVHANLLRLRPEAVRARVLDCRHAVEQGIPFAAHVQALGAVAAVSGGFFLYSEPDIDPPSRRFDPVGLLVSEGTVLSPPVFSRGALLFDREGRWSIERCRLTGVRVLQGGAAASLQDAVTRSTTEVGPDAPSVSVAAGEVVAVGRRLRVPLNGFVVPSTAQWSVGTAVSFSAPSMDCGAQVHEGVAGGPLLVQEGAPCLDLRAEGFWGTAPPLTFSQDETGDRNTLPRLAAGIDADGRLVLVAVDGRNFERALGMTLGEVGELLASLGCVVATNLDGGSSKRMVVQGKTLDLASTEVEQGTPQTAKVRPVHTAVVFMPA